MECVALNYCSRFKGYSLKALIGKCKKIKSLLLQNTGIEDNAINAVDWDQTALQELDLSSTDLSEQALLDLLCHLPPLVYLSVSNCDGFTDKVIFKYKHPSISIPRNQKVIFRIQNTCIESRNVFLYTRCYALKPLFEVLYL